MTYEDRNLFRMGQRVNDTLLSARVGTLRPSRLEMKTAAASLNIQQSLAWKAWNTYTWMVD